MEHTVLGRNLIRNHLCLCKHGEKKIGQHSLIKSTGTLTWIVTFYSLPNRLQAGLSFACD